MMRHLRNFLIGTLLGITVWVGSGVMLVVITEYCWKDEQTRNMENHITSLGVSYDNRNISNDVGNNTRISSCWSIGDSWRFDNALEVSEVNYANTITATITSKRAPTRSEIEAEINLVFGSNDWGHRVVLCESRYDWLAYNEMSGASGLYQFLETTYYANGGTDIWDWREQILVAKKMFDNGQAYQWSCK